MAYPYEVSDGEWLALFQAAERFYKAKPWEEMYDFDLFGLKNPEDGQTALCCVLGNAEQVYALNVYRGNSPLEQYKNILKSDPQRNPEEFITSLDLLMASFEDRGALEKEDLALIKRLNLTYRGRNAWPMFRSYRPGSPAWYLTADEVRFLTYALEQGLEVYNEYNEGGLERLEYSGLDSEYLIRVPEVEGDKMIWHDEWIKFGDQKISGMKFYSPVTDKQRERVAALKVEKRRELIVDLRWSIGSVVGDNKTRPYYPKLIILMDPGSGIVLDMNVFAPTEDQAEKVRDLLLSYSEKKGGLPAKILIQNNEVKNILSPLLEKTKTEIVKYRSFPMLDEMMQMMNQRGFDR